MGRIALKDFAFSNGLKVPKGAFLSCAARALHSDEEIYDHPDVFDPFRFSNVRVQGHGEETKHQLVATAVSFPSISQCVADHADANNYHL